MKKKRLHRGFTVAELLIVVAIIAALAGVSFVAVPYYQRSMTQLEWDAVAKEIFIAAQNHLTMAEMQGYPGIASEAAYGTKDTWTATDDGIFYYTIPGSSAPPDIFNLMLPFGSIDETVRSGNYIVRYRANPGTVLDVFYWSDSGNSSGFGSSRSFASTSGYGSLEALRGDANKSARKSINGRQVIGWYGTDRANENKIENLGDALLAPSVTVKNEDKLTVEVTNPNTGCDLKLIMTGESSKAKAAFALHVSTDNPANSGRITLASGVYTVLLDNIAAAKMHFADLNNDTTIVFQSVTEAGTTKTPKFIPGENIKLQAIAYSNNVLTNIAYSNEVTTNSLFADISKYPLDDYYKDQKGETLTNTYGDTSPWITAMIGSIRHLENLDASISWLDCNDTSDNLIQIGNAVQIADIDWTGYIGKVGNAGSFSIYKPGSEEAYSTSFVPVNPSHMEGSIATGTDNALKYDGRIIGLVKTGVDASEHPIYAYRETGNHIIKNIVVSNAADAGLFGTLQNNSSVSNLILEDFSIATTGGNAGALAGTIKQTDALGTGWNVSNVLAYNTATFDAAKKTSDVPTATIAVTGDDHHVGGLIGKLEGGESGKAIVRRSAAALVVSSEKGNAGGLIGTADHGELTACYAGGHTKDGKYYIETGTGSSKTRTLLCNVTATGGTAGGLIGVATNMGAVTDCYSTCSATGVQAGGFAGTFAGTTLTNCYATGLVSATGTDSVSVVEGANTKTVTLPKDGAFAYTLTGTPTNCQYFEIVNERVERETDATHSTVYVNAPYSDSAKDKYVYLSALKENGSVAGITALDASADAYEAMAGSPSTWDQASEYSAADATYKPTAYDAKLKDYYTVTETVNNSTVSMLRYNLRTALQLGTATKARTASAESDYIVYSVATHYGDWPAPETFVINN